MNSKWMAALAAAALLLGACGGGADRTKAQVRLVNASGGYSSLDLRVDDTLRQGQVGYGATAGYVEVDPGKAATAITVAGSTTALLSFTPSVSKSNHYTLLAFGAQGALKQIQLDEDVGAPDTGKALVRVINAAPDAGPLDLYLTGSSDVLAASVPVLSSAAVGTLGSWLTVSSTTWRLRVTAAGSKTDVRLDLPALVLSNRQVATLVLTPGRGGVLVNQLLLSQQGDIGRLDNPQARVRVAAGVAGGGAVIASVGGTTLLNGVGSPAVGLYALVPAGSQAVAVSVNGTALASSAVTLASGGDYSLLVYGLLAVPKTGWIEDDNRLSLDTTQARLRLVNGLADLSAALAMTADFVPVADGVLPGTASSAYASVAGTTTAKLSVTATGVSNPLFTAVDQTLTAGANYTVFLLGASSAPTGILRKDR